jgi:hypothetical protein
MRSSYVPLPVVRERRAGAKREDDEEKLHYLETVEMDSNKFLRAKRMFIQ